MKKFKDFTIQDFLNVLAEKQPVPGGGAATALSASLGVSLLSMVLNYSIGKSKPAIIERKLKNLLKSCEKIRRELLMLVDLDARMYLEVVRTRKLSKRMASVAQNNSRQVMLKVAKLCYESIGLTPFIVEHGNANLLSDSVVAIELLQSAFNASLALAEVSE